MNFQFIPAIDLLDGKVVRLTQGDYKKVDLFETSPADFARQFENAGVKRIHIVDLNGAKDGSLVNLKAIESIRAASTCKLELGGGIRTLETVKQLLDLGIDYPILGSLFIKNWTLSQTITETFPNRIIAGVDIRKDDVAIQGWLEKSNTSTHMLITKLNQLPLESIIVTDIEKDGMMQGPNLELLSKISDMTNHPIIASGGIRNLEDILCVKELKNGNSISGCIVGKAVLSGQMNLNEILKSLNS